MDTYSDETVQDLVDGVWQTLGDDALRDLTQHHFNGMVGGYGASAEELADAWYEFGERRLRVFG